MAFLQSIESLNAPHVYPQEEVLHSLSKFYSEDFKEKFSLPEVFKNSQVENRFFAIPLEKLSTLGSFVERNQLYLEKGIELSKRAIQGCLKKAQISPQEIDTVIFVSSTGFVVPSLETHLIHSLEISPSVQRIPVVGWGCTGGIAGLRLAKNLADGKQDSKILLVNLELCSFAFQESDQTAKSVIANAIFNDGVSATLVVSKKPSHASLELLETQSHLFQNTSHLMGWKQLPSGLEVILSPEIPELAHRESRSFIQTLLEKSSLSLKDISLWMLHPGGAKILQAFERALELSPEWMELSWKNLKQNGNISSCSVLFGLQKILENDSLHGYGITCAFGPGFTCEGLLFSK